MAVAARDRLAVSSGGYQRRTLLDAARRHIGDETRMRIAKLFGSFAIDWDFDDALADGFLIVASESEDEFYWPLGQC